MPGRKKLATRVFTMNGSDENPLGHKVRPPITLSDRAAAIRYKLRDIVFPKALDVIPRYEFEEGVVELRRRVARILDDAEERPVSFIGIGGESGSCKTTLAKELGYPYISLDDYFKVKYRKGDHDRPKGVEFSLLRAHLNLLGNNEPILKPVYKWEKGAEKRRVPFYPAPVIVVEGLLALDRRIAGAYALRVYMESDRDVAKKRIVERGVRERKMEPEYACVHLEEVVEPLAKIYARNTKRQADIIIFSR